MVIRRTCSMVVTITMALMLVIPSLLTLNMMTISVVVVRARRLAASAVADYACLPTLVCVIVSTLAKFRVQTPARNN